MKKASIKLTPKPEKAVSKAIKINLSVTERLNFPSILPPSGSMIELDMAEALAKRVSITEKEYDEYEFKELSAGRIAYKEHQRQFQFEPYEILLIQQGVRMHDTARTLSPKNKALAKRFLDIVTKERDNVPA